MADLTPKPNSTETPGEKPLPGPLSCFSGSFMAGGIGFACYKMMLSIAQTFAAKPIHSDNLTVINITAAVRTLVVGVVALGAGVFALAAFGLLALGLQVLFQGRQSTPPS